MIKGKLSVKERILGTITFPTGLILLPARTKGGKTILSFILHEMEPKKVDLILVNEPGCVQVSKSDFNSFLDQEVNNSEIVILDSITTLVLENESGPAMKGGRNLGQINFLRSLSSFAHQKELTIICTYNDDIMPFNFEGIADAVIRSDGLFEGKKRRIEVISRSEARQTKVHEISNDTFMQGCIEYIKTMSPSIFNNIPLKVLNDRNKLERYLSEDIFNNLEVTDKDREILSASSTLIFATKQCAYFTGFQS